MTNAEEFSIRVYDIKGKLLQEFVRVGSDHDLHLSLIGASMDASGDPDQGFKVRVEDGTGSGYWMEVAPRR